MPTERQPGCPFDPPKELIEAREQSPISRFPFPDGHQGWLVTGYDLVRSILADSRFSSRKELMRHHPTIDYGDLEVPPAPPGEFLLMDEPQHGRYRKPLVGKFTVRRMRQLTERVEQVTAEHLDAMEQAGPTADLVTAFAKPIPAVIICELLGVPYEDRGRFQENIDKFLGGEAGDEELIAAYIATQQYLAELEARSGEEILRFPVHAGQAVTIGHGVEPYSVDLGDETLPHPEARRRVSREHLQLELTGSHADARLVAVDLGSSGGTEVLRGTVSGTNKRKMDPGERMNVGPKDQLVLGRLVVLRQSGLKYFPGQVDSPC